MTWLLHYPQNIFIGALAFSVFSVIAGLFAGAFIHAGKYEHER